MTHPNQRFFPRRPVAPKPTQGVIRPIYAGVFDLDPDLGFDRARQIVDEWLRRHRTVAPYAADLSDGDFELDRHLENDRLLAQYLTSNEGNIIVARLQHQESASSGRFDPIRNWRTDITIERDAGAAWIATRTWFAGLASDPRRCSPPNFIKSLLSERALSDLDILEPEVRPLEFEAEAGALADLILDSDRDLPIVIISDGCPLDPVRVAQDSAGLAHVVRLTRPVRLALMKILGPDYDLQHGSISTFYATSRGERGIVASAKFETVIGWRYGESWGPRAFATWLHEEIARAVVLRLLNDPAHRTIEGVKAMALTERRAHHDSRADNVDTLRQELTDANELNALYVQDNSKLTLDLKELTERAEAYLNESKSLAESLRVEEKRNRALQAEKASLLHLLAAKQGETAVVMDANAVDRLIDQQPTPNSMVEAVERAKEIFELYGARVLITNTAFESAFDSPFKRPKDILAALLRLGFLWDSIKNAGRSMEDAIRELVRHPCALHESETAKNKFGGERIAAYDGGQAMLEKHLKIGNGGPDTAVRIYFGDRDGELMVGHVGRHLTVAKTQ